VRHPPVVRREGRSWACNGWECGLGDGVIQLNGAGSRLDALRALSVAAWDTGAPFTRHALTVLDESPLPSNAK